MPAHTQNTRAVLLQGTPEAIRTGFTAVCSRFQQLPGTPSEAEPLQAAATPPSKSDGGWLPAADATPQTLRAQLQRLQQQEEEAGRLRARMLAKIEALRSEARELRALDQQKKQLEETVEQLRDCPAALDELQRQHARLAPLADEAQQLRTQAAEMEADVAELDTLKVHLTGCSSR